jgi:XTP/dITP diphosphohydrolase
VRRPLLLATRNAGKRAEVIALAERRGLTVESLDAVGIEEDAAEDALEDGDSFEANALAKARWFSARSAGRVTLADDSGLCVDALGGRPGVWSKRWAGAPSLSGAALDAHNNAHLAAQLRGVRDRSARFVCAVACVWSGGSIVRRGETRGRILEVARGTGGFGYDPWFWSIDLQQSFGEATRVAKNRVSHRARAFEAVFEEFVRMRVDVVD